VDEPAADIPRRLDVVPTGDIDFGQDFKRTALRRDNTDYTPCAKSMPSVFKDTAAAPAGQWRRRRDRCDPGGMSVRDRVVGVAVADGLPFKYRAADHAAAKPS
jgi:hypothetical protein